MRESGVFKCKTKRILIFMIPLFLVITLTLIYSFSPLVFAWVGPTEAPPGTSLDLGECSNHLDFECACFPEDWPPVGWHECAGKKLGENCGGGKIAYHDGKGGGLIAHSTDNNGGNTIQWGCRGKSVGFTFRNLGMGLANTNAIVAYHNNTANFGGNNYYSFGGDYSTIGCNVSNNGGVAAKICSDLSSEGYDDWYLPSLSELAMLYTNRVAIGGFLSTSSYWSSSESPHSFSNSVGYQTDSGSWASNFKSNSHRVRCVRYFDFEPPVLHPCATVAIGGVCGGGKVASHDGNGRGLVASSADNSTGVEWGCTLTTVGASGTITGTGDSNTAAILSGCATRPIAASVCDSYESGGFTNWFLPSKNELNTLYTNRILIGGFQSASYWSSSEANSFLSWYQDFADAGFQDGEMKTASSRVRCVWAF